MDDFARTSFVLACAFSRVVALAGQEEPKQQTLADSPGTILGAVRRLSAHLYTRGGSLQVGITGGRDRDVIFALLREIAPEPAEAMIVAIKGEFPRQFSRAIAGEVDAAGEIGKITVSVDCHDGKAEGSTSLDVSGSQYEQPIRSSGFDLDMTLLTTDPPVMDIVRLDLLVTRTVKRAAEDVRPVVRRRKLIA